ncbi:hypothetical protein BH10ACT2_BH10ACT2_15830 [soil metagenome]
MTKTVETEQVPFVGYLTLTPGDPHLVAHECRACGARFFDRRNLCAKCFGADFDEVRVATSGTLRSFTIVAFAGPGVEVPFVAGLVDCDGTTVRGNIINCEPTAEAVTLGMPVRLATYSLGLDLNGVEAINYGFEPAKQEGAR